MNFEKYRRIFGTNRPDEEVTLRKDDSFVFPFVHGNPDKKAYRLFFTGETTLFYFWKGEYDCVAEYCNIEDALNNKEAMVAPYCLDLTNKEPVTYPKIAFKKTLFPPMLSYLRLKEPYTSEWKAGIFAKAENLMFVRNDAKLRITYEIRYKKDDLPNYATINEPDEVKSFDIPVGTYDWQEISIDLTLDKEKIANVVTYIECEGYTGKLLLERPFITSSNGFNIMPDFQPPYLDHDAKGWIGVNLSRKEWPEFEIKLNGSLVYKGEMFERCHKYSECECEIPEGLIKEGGNELEIKLISDYPNPLPYTIREIGLFEKENDRVNIIACPENVPSDGLLCILLKTKKAGMKVSLECESGSLVADEIIFPDAGYNVFTARTGKPANDVKFALVSGETRKEYTLSRIVVKSDDKVLTGTGDMVYINQERPDDVMEYISWYLSNNIGNLFTIRPTYRWCGARVLNEDIWKKVAELMNKLHMKYVHMTDGREFPGATANPSLETLAGENFLGRQSHEFDGAFGYWPHYEFGQLGYLTADYWMKLIRENPKTANTRSMAHNFVIDKKSGKMYNYVDPYNVPENMDEAAELLVTNLRDSKADHTRHTGPSVSFKYFIQAGYKWAGAELMYGPLEMITAFMRGAAYCYDTGSTGGHLAIQWSTTPHDTFPRYRRYQASLYSAYLQGINDINTEEGLWHMEEYYNYFNRETDACKEHKKAQQTFFDYVSSHSRTGSFYTPFAFIFGRADGFRCFGIDTVFARAESKSEAPEYSWELLNEFYPLERANGDIYLHPCPEDHEVGMLSGTPRGNADCVPIETSLEKLSAYKVLFFLGYNKAVDEDMDKLLAYAENGGTLVLGWPHISETVRRSDVVSYKHTYSASKLAALICEDRDSFVKDTINGEKAIVNTALELENAEVISSTDAGIPLVVKYNTGKGRIFFVNAKEYPAEKAVEPVYRELIRKLSDELNNEEKTFVECDDLVQFAVYKQENGNTHIYVTPVDWYHEPDEERKATLVLDSKRFEMTMNFGTIIKIVSDGVNAAWTDRNNSEVLSLADNKVTLQGKGEAEVFIAGKNGIKSARVVFDEAVKTIDF